jgi:uncharacterized NAD-dependent epimerase/dehydratase family protein
VSVSERLGIFTGGLFDDLHAKTAHGVIRYATRDIACVVDARHAGRRADDVMPYCARPVPIVASVGEAAGMGANRLLIGVAPSGGKLTAEWRAALAEAMAAGMDVEAGLHTVLADDQELSALAARHGVSLHDLRASPPDLDVPRGPAKRAPGVFVVESVGSDCAIGKMSVTLELDRAARERGERSVFVATGQTGIAIAGWGIAVDHVISDYIAGAAERLVDEGARRGDLLFVEGQGALHHPAYSGVTLGLLHGAAPDALVLCHLAGARRIDGYAEVPIRPLPELVAAYEAALEPLRPAPVVAIALNTMALDAGEARAAIAACEEECGIAVDDPVRFGPDHLLDAVLAARGAHVA